MTGAAPHQPEYLGGWLSEQLAEDGEIHELGVHVRVAGEAVFLSGVVSTDHRRDLVGARAAELLPGYRVCNEVTVASYAEPSERESLA